MSGLYEVTEESLIQAHKAGIAYWERNRNINPTEEAIASLARSRHWHDGDCYAFVAGFFGAKRRAEQRNKRELAQVEQANQGPYFYASPGQIGRR